MDTPNNIPMGVEKTHGGRVAPHDRGGRVDPLIKNLQKYDGNMEMRIRGKYCLVKQRGGMSDEQNNSRDKKGYGVILSKLFATALAKRRREESVIISQTVIWKNYRDLCEKARENPTELIKCDNCLSPVVEMENYGKVCSHILSNLLRN